MSLASLLCSGLVQPSPVHLPLYIKALGFFNMDQEMISSVMGICLFACESLTDNCIELLCSRAWDVLLTISFIGTFFL